MNITFLKSQIKSLSEDLDESVFMWSESESEAKRMVYAFESLRACGEMMCLLGDLVGSLERELSGDE